MVISTRLIVTF